MMKFRPTIENWNLDNPLHQLPAALYTCVECDGTVKIDLKCHYLQAIETPLIFDDTAKQILAAARKDRSKPIPRSIIVALRQRNFKRVPDDMTGLDVVRLILGQT